MKRKNQDLRELSPIQKSRSASSESLKDKLTSTQPPVRKLNRKIPVEISERLQYQIIQLCREVPKDEWSGVLFYEVEGSMKEGNLKCKAKEVFLMDIGNPGYTEYDYGDKDLMKYLMANPEVRKMVKGHIHSHATGTVFFSTTDENELYDNSERHNMYLSIIVNNRNEIIGRVAWRGSQKKDAIELRDEKGNLVEVTLNDESPCIFECECEIVMPELPEMKSRITKVKSSNSSQTLFRSESSASEESKIGFRIPEKSKEEKKTILEEGAQRREDKSSEGALYEFVIKLLHQDLTATANSTGGLVRTLMTFEEAASSNAEATEDYYKRLSRNVSAFYKVCYPKDTLLKNFKGVVIDAANLVNSHILKAPKLVSGIREAIIASLKVQA